MSSDSKKLLLILYYLRVKRNTNSTARAYMLSKRLTEFLLRAQEATVKDAAKSAS